SSRLVQSLRPQNVVQSRKAVKAQAGGRLHLTFSVLELRPGLVAESLIVVARVSAVQIEAVELPMRHRILGRRGVDRKMSLAFLYLVASGVGDRDALICGDEAAQDVFAGKRTGERELVFGGISASGGQHQARYLRTPLDVVDQVRIGDARRRARACGGARCERRASRLLYLSEQRGVASRLFGGDDLAGRFDDLSCLRERVLVLCDLFELYKLTRLRRELWQILFLHALLDRESFLVEGLSRREIILFCRVELLLNRLYVE